MSRQPRRHFTTEFEEQAVARLSDPGASQTSVARALGATPSRLKGWRLELAELQRENRRLKEKVEVMRKTSASPSGLTRLWMGPAWLLSVPIVMPQACVPNDGMDFEALRSEQG